MKKLLNTLYVTNPDAFLRKKDDTLSVLLDKKEVMSIPFHLLEGVVLFGHAGCSTTLLGTCASEGITTVLLDERGRFQARVEGPVSGNVLLRKEQYRRSFSETESLEIAKRFVMAKIRNARTVMQHYVRDYPDVREQGATEALDSLRRSQKECELCKTHTELLGIEGNAARSYFHLFGLVVRTRDEPMIFPGRVRRPPTDPINSALSFFYTMLSRDVTSACEASGLDVQVGYLHACRPGRPSLALDLMEEMRSPVVDRFVLSLFNRKQLNASDFRYEGTACFFTEKSIKKVLVLWQEKKQETVTHPFLNEKIKLGLVPFVQAQLFSRFLRGDLDGYPPMFWR